MSCARVCWLLLGMAAAGCGDGDARTTVKLDLDAPGRSITALQLGVTIDGALVRDTTLPPGGGPPSLPGSVVLVVPDVEEAIGIALDATDSTGAHIFESSSVTSRPHQQVSLAITIAPDDVRADLAGVDLAGADLSMPDLAPPPVDLLGVDLSNADLAPRNPLVQVGPLATGGNMISASLPVASRPGTMLVLSLAFDKGANPSGPSGWAWWIGNSTGNSASIFYLANNPGGVTSASAMLGGAGASVGQLSEWDTVTAEDKGVWCWNSNQVGSVTCTTNPTTGTNDLALAVFSNLLNTAGTETFSPAAGFTTIGDNGATSTALHYHFSYRLGLPSATPVTATVGGATGRWAGVLVSFK